MADLTCWLDLLGLLGERPSMSTLELQIIPVTPFQQNCSLLWDKESLEAVLVDPGGEPERILEVVKSLGVTVKEIWLTHGHLDHAGGAKNIREQIGVPVIGPHEADQFWMDTIAESWAKYGHAGMGDDIVPDKYLKDGDTLSLASTEFKVLHTPGHTPGHVVIYNLNLKLAFVGDVLFRGSIGRTDFPKGNHQELLDSITQKLWPLGPDMRFIPGHGPMGTFGQERQDNPFVSDDVVGAATPNSSGVM